MSAGPQQRATGFLLFHLSNTEQILDKFSTSLHFIANLSISCAICIGCFVMFIHGNINFKTKKEHLIISVWPLQGNRPQNFPPFMHILVKNYLFFSAYLPKCALSCFEGLKMLSLVFFNLSLSHSHLGSEYIWIQHSVIELHYSLWCYIKGLFMFPH